MTPLHSFPSKLLSTALLVKLVYAASAVLMLLGITVIFGWFSGNLALVQIHSDFVTMKFNTAFLFLLCGAAIVFALRQNSIGLLVSAAVIVIIALLTLIQTPLGVNFGIDSLVIKHDVAIQTSSVGRMAPNTALAFILCGVCLFTLNFLRDGIREQLIASILGASVLSLGMLAVVGYAIELNSAYFWGKYTAMALHTALGFCLAGAALIFVCVLSNKRLKRSIDSVVLAALGTTSLGVILSLSISLQNQQQNYQQKLIASAVERASQTVQAEIRFLIEALERFGGRWEAAGGLTQQAWLVDATQYVDTFPKLRAIEWVDRDYVIRKVIPYAGNEGILNLNLATNPKRLQIVENAKNTSGASIANSVELLQGGRGFLSYNPLWIEGDFDGFIVGVIDADKLFTQTLDLILLDEGMWLSVHENNQTIFHSHESAKLVNNSPSIATRDLSVYGVNLTFSAGTLPGSWLTHFGNLPFLVFFIGCLLTGSLVTSARGYLRSRRLLNAVEGERLRFHQLIEGAPSAILLANSEGEIEFMNSKAEQLFGFHRDELLGKRIEVLVPLAVRGEHTKWREHYAAKPQTRNMAGDKSFTALHKLGHEIPVEIFLSSISTETGPKVLASVFDTTEKTRQIDQLRKTSNDLDRAGRMAKVGGWEVDLKNEEIKWSDQTCRIHGVEPGYKPDFNEAVNFYPPEAAERINSAIENALENGEPWFMDLPLIRADGEQIWVRVQGEVEHENGEPRRLLGAIQDITERTLFLRELERRNHELDSFAHIASHDLKSPLRGIDQLCSWMEEDLEGKLDETSSKHLALIRSRIDRMENLLSDLLRYARAGRKEGTPEEVDAAKLVRDTFDLCRGNSDFRVFLEGDFPVFTTTRTPLELIIRNLISNAIKHHDRKTGEIVVSAGHLGNFYVFEVRDDGPGIPEEYRERAFGMFQTLKSRDEVEGSGMGLAIIKKTVETFGGTVELLANKSRGTIFRFTWPDKIE